MRRDSWILWLALRAFLAGMPVAALWAAWSYLKTSGQI